MSPAKALIPAIRPLLSAALQNILHMVSRVFPHAEQGLKRKRGQGTVLHCCLLFLAFSSCVLCLSFDLTKIRKQLQKTQDCPFAKLFWSISQPLGITAGACACAQFPDLACVVSEDDLMFSEDEDEEVCLNGQTLHSQLKTPAAKTLLNLNRYVGHYPGRNDWFTTFFVT